MRTHPVTRKRLLLVPLLAVALLLAVPVLARAAETKGADLDNDGIGDIGVVYAYDPAAGKLGLSAFESTGESGESFRWRNLWTTPSGFLLAQTQTVLQDVNADGYAEPVMLYGYGGNHSAMFAWTRDAGSGWPYARNVWWESWGFDAAKAKVTMTKRGDYSDTYPPVGSYIPVVLYDRGRDMSAFYYFTTRPGPRFTPSSGPNINFIWSRSTPLGGDFDGDGFGEVAVVYDYGDANTAVWVFRNNTTGVWWKSALRGFDAKRARWAAGDFTGDGRDDIAALYLHPDGRKSVFVFVSDGRALQSARWAGPGTTFPSWSTSQVTASDVSGDKKADLVIFNRDSTYESGIWVYVSEGDGMANSGWPMEWSRLTSWSWTRSRLMR